MAATDNALMETDLPLPGRRQGKVRDIYDAKGSYQGKTVDALMIVASDRLSAFDVVMPNGVPGKGIVLTQISAFWFQKIKEAFGKQLQIHLLSTDPADVPGITPEQQKQLRGRIMLGRKAKVVPIECVCRGYLAGSGWKEYQQSGMVCGVKLPAGLRQCDRLPEPIFTPATKAETGHDENISFEQACQIVGSELMHKLREWTLAIYSLGHDYAADRGIILADTKFEFGRLPDGQIVLVDEVLTPDSSRFWPASRYEPGREQESFDKQFVRNYLEKLVEAGKWDKTPPGPILPREVIQGTLDRYLEAYRLLTGEELDLGRFMK